MSDTPGPETPDAVSAMLDQVDAAAAAEADPDWQARYGKNLAGYSHSLFGPTD